MRAGTLVLSLALLAAANGAAKAGEPRSYHESAAWAGDGGASATTRYASAYDMRGHRPSRSVQYVPPLWPGSEGAPYGTSGTGANSVAIIQINRAAEAGPQATSFQVLPGAIGPKVIDVESARLDRRPYGANGLDIVYSGTTKIIRISPNFRRGHAESADGRDHGETRGAVEFAKLSPAEQAVTVYPDPDAPVRAPSRRTPSAALPDVARIPVPMPAPDDARLASGTQPTQAPAPAQPSATASAAAGLEPWTEAWLRDCVSRYPSFDASLGTYTDETGRRRFCTGDAAQ